MQLRLKNKDILTLFNVVDRLKVTKMKANRGRAKLITRLREKFKDYHEDEKSIIDEYVEIGNDGLYLRDDEGQYILKDQQKLSELNELLQELADEEVIIKAGEYSKRYMDFLDYLSESEEEFSSDEIVLIDSLLEQYESSKGEDNENLAG